MGEGLKPPCPKIVRGQKQLTPEQATYARAFARERLAAMRSTAPIDEQAAEAQLRQIYRAAGVKPPQIIRWFDSPLSFLQAHMSDYERLSARSEHDCDKDCRYSCTFPRMQFLVPGWWSKIRDPDDVNGQIFVGRATVKVNVGKFKETGVVDDVLRNLRKVGTWNRNWKTMVEASIWNSEDTPTTWCNLAFMMISLAACHHALALAPHHFFHEVFEENELIHLARFNEMVSGYYLGDKEALVVRKPTLVELDAQGRLHSATGPCIQYRDGWSIYAWHGGHVPEKVILHPEHVTWEDLVGRQNGETRRAIRERLGFARFIELVGGNQIDTGRQSDQVGGGWTPPCPKIVRGQQQLTPEQEAYAREFARERLAAVLSTTAIDEQEAETYLRTAYRVAGEEPPAVIRWFDSPLSFVQACGQYFEQLHAQPGMAHGMQNSCAMYCEGDCRLRHGYPSPWSVHVWHTLGSGVFSDVQRCMGTSGEDRIGAVVRDSVCGTFISDIAASEPS
jgi:hypothetical protein